MSYPVKELITKNIEDSLKGITTSNGYAYTLNVQRYVGTAKYVPEHLKAIVYQDGEDRVDDAAITKDERWLRIAIDVFVMPKPTDTTPVDTYCNVIEADINRALLTDYHRGGVAIDTKIEPADIFAEYGEADGMTIIVLVHYRTKFGDMYTYTG